MEHLSDLPDTSSWQPTQAPETLREGFAKRCAAAEESMRQRAGYERQMALRAFDSGLPTEEIVRDELSKILPARYSVRAATLVDASGETCGDCDIVVFNDAWFPSIKPAPTGSTRQVMLPIEGVYAVGEVKQTLSAATLDHAMRKLVTSHRLGRHPTFAHRLVENREHCDCQHGISNPLYSFIVAFGVAEGETFQALVERFFDINRTVRRLEVVRALTVIGHGTVVWGFDLPEHLGTGSAPALFMEADLYEPIYPVLFRADRSGGAVFPLVANLMLHLFHTVLSPDDLPASYGPSVHVSSIPSDRRTIQLPPDPEWLARLATPCSRRVPPR